MNSTRHVGSAASAELSTLDLGDVELTYLPDGVHHVESRSQFPTTPERVWARHPEVFDEDGFLVMSVGSVLIRTAQHRVLVDLGFGPRTLDLTVLTNGEFTGDLIGGRLLESIAAVGLTPSDIDAVVFTHLHLDHVGWLEAPGVPGRHVFERARYLAHHDEWMHWSRPENIALGASATTEQIALLRERIETPAGRAPVVPGVTMVPTPGHTPGHISVLAEGSEGSALVLGDALHCPVELSHPGQTFAFDLDPERAADSRHEIERILSEPRTWFAGGHFPDRIFGRMKTRGGIRTLDWADHPPAH